MFTGILGDLMWPFVSLFRDLIIVLFQLN